MQIDESKKWKNMYHANTKHTKAGVAILIERKTKILQDKEY